MQQAATHDSPIMTLTSSDCVADLLRKGHVVRVRVQGRSMAPLIPDGSVLTLQPIPGNRLQLGDVALYSSHGDRQVCHRLLARRQSDVGTLLGFRGDAFTDALEWVTASSVTGKVVMLDDAHVDNPISRSVGWTRAWRRWIFARARIKLGAWRRRMGGRP